MLVLRAVEQEIDPSMNDLALEERPTLAGEYLSAVAEDPLSQRFGGGLVAGAAHEPAHARFEMEESQAWGARIEVRLNLLDLLAAQLSIDILLEENDHFAAVHWADSSVGRAATRA